MQVSAKNIFRCKHFMCIAIKVFLCGKRTAVPLSDQDLLCSSTFDTVVGSYTPGIRSMQWGYIVFVFSVCLSVCQSVC